MIELFIHAVVIMYSASYIDAYCDSPKDTIFPVFLLYLAVTNLVAQLKKYDNLA